MAECDKPEVHLEISSGFFRIPTDQVIYNITVIGPAENVPVRIVERIVEVERKNEETRPAAPPPCQSVPEAAPAGNADNYYKQVSNDIYQDIGKLAKSLSLTISEIPAEDRRQKRAELDEAGEKIEAAKRQLKDIVAMTESATMAIMDNVEGVQQETRSVIELLSLLKNHKAFTLQEEVIAANDSDEQQQDAAGAIHAKLDDILALVTAMQADRGAVASPAALPPAIKHRRLLFDLDVVFQTIYELCTNETVKTHITSARQRRDEIFQKDLFLDTISERIKSLLPDSDNFLTVPMTDVFLSLHDACSDKAICNLMKKMDGNQASIFLDQFLPLEMPPVEEIEEAQPAPPPAAPAGPDPRLEAMMVAVGEARELVADLSDKHAAGGPPRLSAAMSIMATEDKRDIFNKIEQAFNAVSQISSNVERILESLSFQDLSGQQIMKIIKLLSDFQLQLLAIIVSFGSQLKRKEEDKAITFAQGKSLAQNDVDAYLARLADADSAQKGLDQNDVNSLLEQLGF